MPTVGYQPVWYGWNNSYTTGTFATTTTVSTTTWGAWNSIYVGTGATTVSSVTSYFTLADAQWGYINNQYQETEDQRAAREERTRIAQADRVRIEAERAAAEATARELLMSHLDAKQKRDWLESGWFEVVSDKGRRWRIRSGSISGNVDLMPEEGDVRDASYCAHLYDEPRSDHWLAQKIALEVDEELFTDIANRHYANPTATQVLPNKNPERYRERVRRLQLVSEAA